MFGDYYMQCTKCKVTYSASTPIFRCKVCGDTLEVPLNCEPKIDFSKTYIKGIFSHYRGFFPYFKEHPELDLGEGGTPLLDMPRIAETIGVGQLLIKNETVNPTWSFKDRGTASGLRRAIELGFDKIGTLSTGNMAISVAAFGQRAGLKTFVFVNDHIDAEKLLPIAFYNPFLIKVKADYSELYDESLRIGIEHGIYCINSDEPFRIEGYRTLAFELYEQMDFSIPDYVIVPTSSGGHYCGILKGFRDLKQAGYIDKIPVMVSAQATGCATINNAYEKKLDYVERTISPNTIAHSIENAFPPSGNSVLRNLRRYGGLAISVTDEEILNAQRIMAQNGLFIQPGSAASVAAAHYMGEKGILHRGERVVCIATSTGLKYTSILTRHRLNIYEAELGDLNKQISTLISSTR